MDLKCILKMLNFTVLALASSGAIAGARGSGEGTSDGRQTLSLHTGKQIPALAHAREEHQPRFSLYTHVVEPPDIISLGKKAYASSKPHTHLQGPSQFRIIRQMEL